MDRLSVIIPALDAAAGIREVLACLLRDGTPPGEIIVVDGGSVDDTVALACRMGAEVMTAKRGRGNQMAAGAAAASGEWLLFLHADTVLQADWRTEAANFMARRDNLGRAAVFRLSLDDPSPKARRVEWVARLRSRLLGLPYGDQGLLISRCFHDALGGFRPMPIMEDVDMARRIGCRRLVTLDSEARTSAVRYRRSGYTLRMLRNLLCLACYFAGLPPSRIARFYG